MRNSFFLVLFLSVSAIGQYPDNTVKPSSDKYRMNSAEQVKEMKEQSPLRGIPTINVGPTIMSGRVVDIAVDPDDASHFFVAYATGGVWETINHGNSFSPIFDNNGYTIHTGSLSVDWKNDIIYVGTGEANSSRSSYAGYGMFKSSDNGKTWQHIGLEGSHHIARILIDPDQPNILFAAVMGPLYSPSENRGVYKTEDGGKNWTKVLYVNEVSGIIDIEINPLNHQQLIAASWEKDRRAWDFKEAGEGTGIYISNDNGNTWTKSKSWQSAGNMGRIGLDIADDGVLYALVDNQDRYKKEQSPSSRLSKNDFKEMNSDQFLALNDTLLNEFLKDNRFPEGLNAKIAKKKVQKGEYLPKDFYDYLTDSNAALFEDPVKGAELYRSTDFGLTWTKTHEEVLENICYSYGYYFGTIEVNPKNSSEVYIAGVPLLKSSNGGAAFKFIGADNMHVDHHVIWVNPNNSQHIINGNDGGINISYDGGAHWIKCNSPAVGQFYTVNVDHATPYNIYGGLQDNGVWKGPSNYTYSTSWLEEGKYPYQRLLGGDGMKIQIDEQNGYIYTGYQFGHYYRIDQNTGKRMYIHPMQEMKEAPLRWNWQTPILLSHHNPEIVYMGSNKFHRSTDAGESFKTTSGDLTRGAKKGDVSYGTITSIAESPLEFGLLMVGTDDGKVHISSDGGKVWRDISKGLPEHLWVSRVVASSFNKDRIYVSLNGYRWDDFESYVFCSEDQGNSWKRIKVGDLGPVNVIREDPNSEELLFIGTDKGLFISFDRGSSWEALGDLPPVAVHDLRVQETMHDLVIATHGRSIYKMDLSLIREYQSLKDSVLWLRNVSPLKYRENWGQLTYDWQITSPEIELAFFIEKEDEVSIVVLDQEGNSVCDTVFKANGGFNVAQLKLESDTEINDLLKGENGKYYPKPGKYKVKISIGNTSRYVELTVKK